MIDPMEHPAEDALVAQAQEGRAEAFTELARGLHERIYRTILGMTRNHEDADDLTQETFMVAYKALGGFKRRSGFYTWIYRIAVNLTLNFLKKKGREKGRADFEENAAGFDKSASAVRSPEGKVLRMELRGKLDEAIQNLPLLYRAAFDLVVGQGMSHGRAAELLGCSENTVSWRMHKTRKILQARLGPYLAEVGDEM